MMIWQVKDLAATLARDFQPDQLIAFSIMSDVERRLKISGKLLEATMLELMRLVDQGEPVSAQYLEAAYEAAIESISPGEDKCVVCGKQGHIFIVVALPEARLLLGFCKACQTKPDLFLDVTPLDVFSGRVPSTQITSNFRRQLGGGV